MSSLNEIFNFLEPKQLRINSFEEDDSIFKKIELLDKNYNMWNVIINVINEKEMSTELNKSRFVKNTMESILDNYTKNNLFSKFKYKSPIIKSQLQTKIKNMEFSGYDVWKFISDYFKISLFINNEIVFKIGSYDKVLIFEKGHLIYKTEYLINEDELKEYMIDKYLLEEEDYLGYKKYKINELRELCSKIGINIEKDGKKKIKKELIDEISLKI